ncbi:MAG: signal recognition particle-docking protein FtsY [Oscillospiraceae bacterium]|jgi:fused signal recognition particle receptor|nr:signal recognition particle-docking protein FtsY [Oscillospiraceae bacterium]
MGFIDKLKQGLSKTRQAVSGTLGGLFTGFSHADEAFFEELEEALILADLGVATAAGAVEMLRARCRQESLKDPEAVRAALIDILTVRLSAGDPSLRLGTKPSVMLVIGVNGVGTTTTIGKVAGHLSAAGRRVLLCAGDTFRAAAAEQLDIWAERAGADIVRQHEGADPAAVVFDALAAARARGCDVVLCDTAGRLHNKQNLMNELAKISRIIDRELPGADRETLLVLDATTGQNGLSQAREFAAATGLTGLVLTKLDGTAKGGIVVAVADALQVPVKYVGVGEQLDDLMPFEPRAFVEALLGAG